MNRTIQIICACALLLGGCSAAPSEGDEIFIRAINGGAVMFDLVVLEFPRDAATFDALGAGSASEYRQVEEAFPYARIEVHVGGDVLVLQPVDWVGEMPLPAGRYSFVVDVDHGHVSFVLRHDP